MTIRIPRIGLIIYAICILFLAASIAYAGYFYMFDNDELFNAHVAYLIAKGYTPYKDFIFLYTPLFHWLILPVFSIFGFNFEAIYVLRIGMVILYGFRLFLSSILVARVFGKWTALIFLPLLLWDPISTFVSPQIRPDNLMLTLFVAGLLTLQKAIQTKNTRAFLWTGIVFSLCAITMIKVLPAVMATVAVLFFYSVSKRRMRWLGGFGLGLLLPVILFVSWEAYQQNLFPMIRNMLYDSRMIMDSIWNKTPFGFFYYWSYNINLYGFHGKNVIWGYGMSLVLAGLAGFFLTVFQLLARQADREQKPIMKWVMCSVFLAQTLYLLFGPTAYIQYYLPVNWLLAVFGAVLVTEWFRFVRRKKTLFTLTIGIVSVCSSILVSQTVRANLIRASLQNEEIANRIRTYWRIIPETEAVFPGLLFRPPSYPVVYGQFIGDIPRSILVRFPSVKESLEKRNARYAILNDFLLQFVDVDTRRYLLNRFHPTEIEYLYSASSRDIKD